MKQGSLVKCHYLDKIGVVLRKYPSRYAYPSAWDTSSLPEHDKFDVLWRDGTIGNMWKFDLEVISESR